MIILQPIFASNENYLYETNNLTIVDKLGDEKDLLIRSYNIEKPVIKENSKSPDKQLLPFEKYYYRYSI